MKKVLRYQIKDTGKREEYETGAQRDKRGGKGRFDLLSPATLRALALHFEKGCEKYGDRNWEKGMPASKYMDSALRHAYQFWDGLKDENHLISAMWNLFCLYETILRIQAGKLPKELDDRPHKVMLPDPYEVEEVKKNDQS